MMKQLVLGLLLLVSLPLGAHAAGFATQPLFLSKTPVVEGETVFIHAVVTNDAATTFAGEVTFTDADTKIGAVSVTIAPGGANAVSVSWGPLAGSHSVTAKLTAGDGTVAESQTETFSVAPKPTPATASSASQGAAVESSQGVQDTLSTYAPGVVQAAQPVFTTIDSARGAAEKLINSGIDFATQKGGNATPGEILGEATKNPSPSGIMTTLGHILAAIAYWLLYALRFIVDSAGIFYPVLALLFFYVLWRTFKAFRRPRY